MTRSRLFAAICIALLLMIPPLASARVNPTNGRQLKLRGNEVVNPNMCNGLDIVFLIDQSYSMRLNDRNNNRIEAIRYAIARIGENVLYFCPNVQHRIAVIGFWDLPHGGEDTKVYIQPTLIAPSADWFAQWEDMRKSLGDQIKAEVLGSTDFISAFKRAAPILKAWRENPIGTFPRKQAVVLVADGGPCVVDEGCVPDPTKNTFWRADYLRRLETLLSPNGKAFPWTQTGNMKGVYIWLIAFHDAKGGPYEYLKDETLMQTWQRVTKGRGGDVIVLKKGATDELLNPDLAPRVTEILDNVLGSELIRNKCGEPIPVPPYVDSLVLHIFKVGANQGTDIRDVKITVRHERKDGSIDLFQQGKVVKGEGTIREYTQNGPNERYVLAEPDPGNWYVTAEGANMCKDVDVRFMPVDLSYRVLSPAPHETLPQIDEPPYYDVDAPISFRYRVTEKLSPDKPVRVIPGYPLTIALEVHPPEGDVQTCELQRQANGDYKCEDPLLMRVPGTYHWQIRATTPSVQANEETTEVFNDSGSFKVSKVDRFGFEFVRPMEAEENAVNQILNGSSVPVPVSVSVRLVDVSGQPLLAKDVIANLDETVFTATIQGPDQNVLEEVALTYNKHKGFFEGELRTAKDLGVTLDPPGEYKIEVSLLDNYQSTKFRPRYRSQSVTFSRSMVTPIDYKIISEEKGKEETEQPLYQGTVACIGAKVVPVEISLAIYDPAAPTKLLDPNKLALKSPSKIFTATLIGPDGSAEPFQFKVQSGKQGLRLLGTSGMKNLQAGDYIIQIMPNPEALQGRYQLLRTETVETHVKREDSFLTRPGTCRAAGTAAGGMALLLIGFLIWNFATRPLGILSFKHRKTGLVLHEEIMGSPLRGWLHWYRSTNPALADVHLNRVEATRATPPEGATRAINLILFDEDGTELLREEGLPSGEDFDLDADIVVRYD